MTRIDHKNCVFDKKIDINDNVFQKERRSVSINKIQVPGVYRRRGNRQ